MSFLCQRDAEKTPLLKWTHQVILSSAPSTVYHQRVEWTPKGMAEFPDSSPNNMQMGLSNTCLHICGIVHDKVSKALIILPGDRTNKINFPFSLWVFKCVLWWRSIVYFWKSCVAERKANRSNDTGMLTNGGPADGFISAPMPGGGGSWGGGLRR